MHGRGLAPSALAGLVDRGARSGIGIGAFAEGGLLVDGGRVSGGDAAPVVARAAFPEDWPLLLILDESLRGLHGAAEIAAFRALPPFPASLAGELCRLVLMSLLPGIAERRFTAVAEAIATMQARLGDYFAPAQGGRFTSPAVAAAIDELGRAGAVGVGQSSWGPTGFALFETMAAARTGAERLEQAFTGRLGIRIVTARNHGATVSAVDEPVGLQRGSA
jgi:beta-RFAP synthase